MEYAPLLQLPPSINSVIARVELASDALSANIEGRPLEARTPSALVRLLTTELYNRYHIGNPDAVTDTRPRLRDLQLESQLADAAGRRDVVQRATVSAEDHEGVVVHIDGVRVHVGNDSVVGRADGTVDIKLPCARPRLSPGFFYSVSSSVPYRGGGSMLRLYARIEDPSVAPSVWRDAVSFLEGANLPWHAKILSVSALYPRNDALVIYLPRPGWTHVMKCADVLLQTGLLGIGCSPFARKLNASVSCAFDPSDRHPARKGMSFGEHRCRVLAEALVRHATQQSSDEAAEEFVHAAFLDADIDPALPARNASSPYLDVFAVS